MSITLDGTNGITTPDVTSTGLTADTTTLVVDDVNDRVGIGTSSPSTKLDVDGQFRVRNGGATGYSLIEYGASATATNNWHVGSEGDGSFRWYNGNFGAGTERARIDSSGNLLVGTTSSVYSTNYKIGVVGPGGIAIRVTDNPGNPMVFQNSSSGLAGYIQVSGTTTSYVSISDYRLKENAQPMTGALAKIAALNPVTYTWKADGSAGQGFIAHELQAVVPDCVTGEKDAVDADGNPVYQGIDTSFLVATLTAAIQEQQTIIEEQKTALEAQQQAIAGLTARVEALEANNV